MTDLLKIWVRTASTRNSSAVKTLRIVNVSTITYPPPANNIANLLKFSTNLLKSDRNRINASHIGKFCVAIAGTNLHLAVGLEIFFITRIKT